MKLTIGNSVSKIIGLSVDRFRELRHLMSYTVEPGIAYFQRLRSNRRFLLDKKGAFPSGLLYIAMNFLRDNDLYPDIEAISGPPEVLIRVKAFDLSLPFEPYPEQIAAAEAAALHHRGAIVAPTGSGKSVIIALVIDRLQVRTLIVVPSLLLKKQLTDTLSECFGHGRVGPLGYPIAVENVDALPMTRLEGYDAIIVDEYHHAAAATYRKLNMKSWTDVYYRIGFSATPFRSDDNERLLLESFLSKTIYEIKYQDCVDNERIVPMEAYYVDLPVQKVTGSTWAQVYSQLVVNNKVRNDIICGLLSKFHANKVPTLCLVKEIKHGDILSDNSSVPFANGEDGRAREHILSFILGHANTLIGTTGVIGEGVDTKPAEVIIMAAGGKSKPQFMQNCGRGFRLHGDKKSCKIILFRDRSHKFMINHFNACVRHLKQEYGVKVERLEEL